MADRNRRQKLIGDVESKIGAIYADETPGGSPQDISQCRYEKLQVLEGKGSVRWCCGGRWDEERKATGRARARKVVLVCTTTA